MNIDDCLDLIVAEHLDTVLQAVIRAVGAWMNEHYTSGRLPSKIEMIQVFEQSVDRTIEDKQYQRRQLPLDCKLPEFNWANVEALSKTAFLSNVRQLTLEEGIEFLGRLTGAWILACPETLIRQAVSEIKSDAKDADLIFVLRKSLAYALDVGGD